MSSPSKPPHAHTIEEAIHSTAEPKSLASVGGPQSAGASVTGAVIAGLEEGIVHRIGRYRWVICALLFFATTINYIDRQVLGILATDKASSPPSAGTKPSMAMSTRRSSQPTPSGFWSWAI